MYRKRLRSFYEYFPGYQQFLADVVQAVLYRCQALIAVLEPYDSTKNLRLP